MTPDTRQKLLKQWLPAWILGAVFIASAAAKLASLGKFEVYLIQQELAPGRLFAAWEARALLVLELFLGLAFFQRRWLRRAIVPGTLVLLGGFSLFLAYQGFILGDTDSCQCFGQLLPMSPLESLVKNLVLIAIAGFLYYQLPKREEGHWSVLTGMAVASLLVVVLGFPVRPPVETVGAADNESVVEDGLPPTPSRFAQFTGFTHAPDADLTQGVDLALFVSLECEHCMDVTRTLAEAQHADGLPPLYLLCLGDEEQLPMFMARTGAEFPHLLIDPLVFFDFVPEKPPRLYLLHEGRSIQHWDEADFRLDAVRMAVDKLPADSE